uniref:4931428L18Rik protein n=1 Tax=Mus musculus TaxID=10090 RepID=B7ZWJ4_MOUSE|nr:4931428L18Rik protein [Mus musculus]
MLAPESSQLLCGSPGPPASLRLPLPTSAFTLKTRYPAGSATEFILLHGNKVADESLSQSLLQTLILLQGGKGIFHLQRDLGRFWLIEILTLIGTSRSTITALKTIQACCHSGRQHQREQYESA